MEDVLMRESNLFCKCLTEFAQKDFVSVCIVMLPTHPTPRPKRNINHLYHLMCITLCVSLYVSPITTFYVLILLSL